MKTMFTYTTIQTVDPKIKGFLTATYLTSKCGSGYKTDVRCQMKPSNCALNGVMFVSTS